jgi:hypothetical protein
LPNSRADLSIRCGMGPSFQAAKHFMGADPQ